jgi:hypothetical protein
VSSVLSITDDGGILFGAAVGDQNSSHDLALTKVTATGVIEYDAPGFDAVIQSGSFLPHAVVGASTAVSFADFTLTAEAEDGLAFLTPAPVVTTKAAP